MRFDPNKLTIIITNKLAMCTKNVNRPYLRFRLSTSFIRVLGRKNVQNADLKDPFKKGVKKHPFEEGKAHRFLDVFSSLTQLVLFVDRK